MRPFILYTIRWQLSTPILAVVLWITVYFGINSFVIGSIIANLIGSIIFYFVDKRIFKTISSGS